MFDCIGLSPGMERTGAVHGCDWTKNSAVKVSFILAALFSCARCDRLVDEVHDLLDGLVEILFGRRAVHGFLQGHGGVQDGKVGINPMLVDALSISGGRATEGHGEAMGLAGFCQLGDTGRALAHSRLLVHAPLACDEQVGLGECLLDADGREDELAAWGQCAVQEGVEGKAKPAGGTGSGHLLPLDAAGFFGQLGKVMDVVVHARDDCLGGTFLRPEDIGAAFRPAERIGDVAGNLECAILKAGVGLRRVDLRHIGKVAARDAGAAAVCLQEAEAECREHAEAAVVGRTAADADDEMAAARVDSREDELAEPVRRRVERVALFRRHKGKPRGIRHLDDSSLRVRQEPVAALDFRAEWPGDRRLDNAAVQPLCHSVYRPFTAVGQREYGDDIAWIDLLDGLLQEPAGVDRGNTTLE